MMHYPLVFQDPHWMGIDLLGDVRRVEKSKSRAAIRSVHSLGFAIGITKVAEAGGTRIFRMGLPHLSNRRHPLECGRKAWSSVLKKAGIPFFQSKIRDTQLYGG